MTPERYALIELVTVDLKIFVAKIVCGLRSKIIFAI